MIALLLAALAGASPQLTLDEAVSLARTAHPEVVAARAGAAAAGARADASGAALLPQLGVSAGWQGQVRDTPGATTRRTGTWSGQATADQLLWDFGRTTGTARAARATARAEEAGAGETALEVVRAARLAYFQARAGRVLVQVARDALSAQAAQLAQVAALAAVGSRPESDLARARSDVAQARLALVQAEQDEAVARAQLAQALGVERSDLEAGDDAMPPVAGEGEAASALLDGAAAVRPSFRQVEAQLAAQEATLSAARGARLPSLSVGATAGSAGEALDGLDRSFTGGVVLSWSLFDGGANGARVREAEAQRVALVARRDAARQALHAELAQALAAVAGGRASVVAAREALTAAEEDLRLAATRYQVGVGTLLEVSTARASASKAAGQVVTAQRDLDGSRADLALALGRGG